MKDQNRKKRTLTQNQACQARRSISIKETWEDIPGYVGIYKISNLGRAKRIRIMSEKLIKPWKCTTGYWQLGLHKNGVKKTYNLHRLLAVVFLQNPTCLKQVNHKDGDKMNCSLENLEWCTASQNSRHAYDVLKITPSCLGKFGKDSNKSKPIVQKTKDGEIVNRWWSGMDAVRAGFKSACISRCCKGKNKTHKGYVWEYA